jgi:hypothetical protein
MKNVATIYKIRLMYFLISIHINNQSRLYMVNGVLDRIKRFMFSFTRITLIEGLCCFYLNNALK